MHTLAGALVGAGVIVCATGNLALREDDVAQVANDASIASVTSSDEELEPGLHEVDHTERSRIASLWLHYFEGRSDVSHA